MPVFTVRPKTNKTQMTTPPGNLQREVLIALGFFKRIARRWEQGIVLGIDEWRRDNDLVEQGSAAAA